MSVITKENGKTPRPLGMAPRSAEAGDGSTDFTTEGIGVGAGSGDHGSKPVAQTIPYQGEASASGGAGLENADLARDPVEP